MVKPVAIAELQVGMTIEGELKFKSGSPLVSAGYEITRPLLERLKNCWLNGLIEDEIMVVIPDYERQTAVL